MKTYDTVILGGGIMGAMSARTLAKKGAKVAIIDQYRLFNPCSASGGKTRSFRIDYLDPLYGTLALQAAKAWQRLESELGIDALIRCGCLNLWDPRLGISWEDSYAGKAERALAKINAEAAIIEKEGLPPVFDCARGTLDPGGGLLFLPPISASIEKELKNLGAAIFENCPVKKITVRGDSIEILTPEGSILGESAVIATGRWAAETLELVSGVEVPHFKLLLDRPISSMYCSPARERDFTPENLPVFACLDIGIYGHPMLQGITPGVKIGFFRPTNAQQSLESWSIERFLESWMPELASCARSPVCDTDLCSYDNTQDGDFIIGEISSRLVIAAGFCGTGYKFAPVVGDMIAGLIDSASYPVPERFNPWRSNI